MLPTMEQAEQWVHDAPSSNPAGAQLALWMTTSELVDVGMVDSQEDKAEKFTSWLWAACALLKAQNKRIVLTDYPAQEVPWHVLGMQLTAAACVGNVASACGELLKWCDKNGVPLCEAMEGL